MHNICRKTNNEMNFKNRMINPPSPGENSIYALPFGHSLENPEDPVVVLRIDPDPVVPHRENPFLVLTLRVLRHSGNVNLRNRVLFPVLDRIPDRILDQTFQLDLVQLLIS